MLKIYRNRIVVGICLVYSIAFSGDIYAAVNSRQNIAKSAHKSLKPYLAVRAYSDMQLRNLSKLASTKKIDADTLFARLQKLRNQ